MKKIIFSILLLSFSFFAGCSVHLKPKVVNTLKVLPLTQERVFQKEKLAKGGKVLVVPFSAGKNIEASDQLDHVALMIVKGIADTLASGEPFRILVEQDAQSADFVIKGRIVQMEQKTPFHMPWRKKTKKLTLKVEESVLGVENEEILAKFSQIKMLESPTDNFETLGYDIGTQIGRCLLESATTKF
jgi:hypothetical protein